MSKSNWKNTMQAFQTAGLPPRSGSTIFPTIGWTMNSSDALTNKVKANNTGTGGSWRLVGTNPKRRAHPEV
jgi:hypothetical protein